MSIIDFLLVWEVFKLLTDYYDILKYSLAIILPFRIDTFKDVLHLISGSSFDYILILGTRVDEFRKDEFFEPERDRSLFYILTYSLLLRELESY